MAQEKLRFKIIPDSGRTVSIMFQTLLKCMMEITIMVAFGYVMRKRYVGEKTVRELSALLIDMTLPCSILASSTQEFNKDIGEGILLCLLWSFIYYALFLALSYLLFRTLKVDDEKRGIATTSSVFSNSSFIGFPLAQTLYGNTGLQYAVANNMFYTPFMFSFGIRLFSPKRLSGKEFLMKLLSPSMTTSVIGIVIYFAGIRFPSVIQSSLSTVGSMTVPLSMMIIGAGLVGIDLRELISDRLALFVCMLRLLVFPLVLAFIMYLCRMPYLVIEVCTLIAAVPVGSFNVILPRQYGGNVQFANRTVILSMVFSLVTIPAVLTIIDAVFQGA